MADYRFWNYLPGSAQSEQISKRNYLNKELNRYQDGKGGLTAEGKELLRQATEAKEAGPLGSAEREQVITNSELLGSIDRGFFPGQVPYRSFDSIYDRLTELDVKSSLGDADYARAADQGLLYRDVEWDTVNGKRVPTRQERRSAADIRSDLSRMDARLDYVTRNKLDRSALGARDDYGLLFRQPDGTMMSDGQFYALVDKQVQLKAIQEAERELNITPKLVGELGTNEQRNARIKLAREQRNNASGTLQQYAALAVDPSAYANDPQFLRAQETFKFPAGRNLSGEGKAAKPSQASTRLQVAVPSAVSPSLSASVPSTGMSLANRQRLEAGDETSDQRRASRAQDKARQARNDALNEFQIVEGFRANQDKIKSDFAIAKLEQETELKKFEQQMEYEKAVKEREELIDAIEGLGSGFTAFFGNLF